MSLAAYGSQILASAADIARTVARRESTRLRWATVTSTDPLSIRYDGEDGPSVVPPQTVAAVAVGDRVRVAVYRGQATILGVGGGSGALLLDELDLAGTAFVGSDSNILTVPARLQGRLLRYELIINAGVDGLTGIVRTLCAQINGDDQANYRSVASWVGGSDGAYSSNATAYPRTAYMHNQVGSARVDIVPAHTSSGWVYWNGTGYWNAGAADGGTFSTGGRWNGPASVGAITHLNVGSSVGADDWVSNSRAQLWGYR